MQLTESEIRDINRYLADGKPLPDKYRFLLFEDKQEVELVWNGKTNEVTNVVLPFQVIEQVDDPLKIARLKLWCEDVNTIQSQVRYTPIDVKQEEYEKYQPKSFLEVVKLFSLKQ